MRGRPSTLRISTAAGIVSPLHVVDEFQCVNDRHNSVFSTRANRRKKILYFMSARIAIFINYYIISCVSANRHITYFVWARIVTFIILYTLCARIAAFFIVLSCANRRHLQLLFFVRIFSVITGAGSGWPAVLRLNREFLNILYSLYYYC